MLVRIGSLVFAVPGVVLLVLYGIELSAFTQCQEIGQFYDVVSQGCTNDKPPFSTFYMRHSLMVNLSLLVASLGALVMTYGMMTRQRAG